jgi:uncharacterized protein (TIGR02453 family)
MSTKTKPALDPVILSFLTQLEKNNNREWFDKNKKMYLEAKDSFDSFVQLLIQTAKSIDPGIGFLEPKNCTFRIYRDVRFSKEKSPFKTNFGAYIAKGGKNSDWAGYYFHLEPSESFIAGGKYMPEGPVLKAIREAIFYEPAKFRGIIEKPSFKKRFPEIMAEKLKTAPQGYPKDHPDIDLLKYKGYAVWQTIDLKKLSSPELIDEIAAAWKEAKPLNDFLNLAMEHVI